MLEELKKMYEKLIKFYENDELTYYQRELLARAKNEIRLLIAMEK
jgi:hypothetical protein